MRADLPPFSRWMTATFIAASLSAHLDAQTTVTYTNGQTDTTARSVSPPNDPTTLTIASGAAIQSGVLSGAGSIIKTGAGRLNLTGANTFLGGVTVSAGTLNVFHNTNLGAAGNAVTLGGGTLQSTAAYSSHPLAISSTSAIDVVSPTLHYRTTTVLSNGALTGSGNLIKTGDGTFYLAAESGNTFSGNITIAPYGGTFRIGSSVVSSPAGGASLNGMTSANTITVGRNGTFNIEDNVGNGTNPYVANRLGTTGNRPAVTLTGGTFSLNGYSANTVTTQTMGTLNLPSGASTISVTRNSAGTPRLVFSSLNRSGGAFVNFAGTFGSSVDLGTAATDAPQVFLSAAPTLVGGGGAAGSTNISILPGAIYTPFASAPNLVTYGSNGVRGLSASEYYSAIGNDINAAATTDNVRISGATPTSFGALSAPKTINALVSASSATATWAMGNTLTLTSGQFIHTGGGLSVSSGTLTAGTGAAGNVDLHITNRNSDLTFGGNIADNGSTVVSLVTNGTTGAGLSISSASNNTYYQFYGQSSLSRGRTCRR